jgi:hypothetical protein
MDAAVVKPCTEPRRKMMMPAPRNPMPETIWAATRDGSTSTVPAARTSLNPYLLTSSISAAAVPTMVWVRIPALLPWSSRSSPMSAVSPKASLRRAVGGFAASSDHCEPNTVLWSRAWA